MAGVLLQARVPELSPDPPWAAEHRVFQLTVSPVGRFVLEQGHYSRMDFSHIQKESDFFVFVFLI